MKSIENIVRNPRENLLETSLRNTRPVPSMSFRHVQNLSLFSVAISGTRASGAVPMRGGSDCSYTSGICVEDSRKECEIAAAPDFINEARANNLRNELQFRIGRINEMPVSFGGLPCSFMEA